MGESTFRREERTGLFVAVAFHMGLVLVLLVQPAERGKIIPTERMTVNLAEDVGMVATAPEPVPESRAATAPEISETPAPALEPVVQPQPAPLPVQPPVRRPVERVQSPIPAPTRAADTRPRRRPEPSRAQEQPRPQQPAQRGGGSRVGDNFLAGAGDSARTEETRTPASQIGASAKASIVQAVARQIKPHWAPPNGPEVDKIVTFVRFRLNENGSLSGRPEVVRQTGINETNRAQAERHAEQAIRAVQLAAPFDLPDEYYEAWKVITANLDWRLAQ